MKIFSLSVVVDGYVGWEIAAAAIVREEGKEVARFEGRLPDAKAEDPKVKEILPSLVNMNVTHKYYEDLDEAFRNFWLAHRGNVTIMMQSGLTLQSELFHGFVDSLFKSRAWTKRLFLKPGETELLLAISMDPTMVDSYIKANGLMLPAAEETLSPPMSAAIAAAIASEHFCGRLQNR